MDTLNDWVGRALVDAGVLASLSNDEHGHPVMIRVNDYDLELFNGDVGLCWRHEGRLQVSLRASDGKPRHVSMARLPAHDPVFAMSIHKSQGSEFDDIAVVLPDEMSPVLRRELIYTAVTRARSSLTVYGSSDIVRASVQERTQRSSGLRDALWSVSE